MFHELQFPFGSGLVVLPALTGGILAMWSQVFVRSVDSADRPPMFLGVLVPATIAGMIAASAGLWNAPLYDETGLPYDTLRNIQIPLYLAFVASLVTIPAAVKLAPAMMLAVSRLRQRQISLALLVALVGLGGPLVFFFYAVIRGPGVMIYVGVQYAILGFILWQLTRPVPMEETVAPND